MLTYTAELTPDNLDPNHAAPNVLFRPVYANDIIYGGLGNDSIHGGAGDDAISGAEALPLAYTTNYNQNGVQIGTITESDFYHPYNPGNPLGYNPATTKFALYDAADPLRKILLTPTGTLSKTGTGVDWILNFNENEGPVDTHWIAGQTTYAGVPTDGDDRIFGDLGNDWLVGGTGRDQMFGGWGDDLLNADDNLNTAGGLNNATDTNPSYEDLAYGGAGRDVLIANTGGDRLVDWVGEFNSFLVPFRPFGAETVGRAPAPAIKTFLLQLSKSDGADPWVGINHGGAAARNGEPFGELGMVVQGDAAWNAQTGGPRDPQPGNSPGSRDVRVSAGTLPIWQMASEPSPTGVDPVAALTESELAPIVAEAKRLWTAALGAGDPRLTALNTVDIEVGNLPAGMLGETTGSSILIDRSAAGWGWFVDPTPRDSSEFSIHLVSGALAADPASAAFGRMDALTTVLHEMGNAMGFSEDLGQDVTGRVLPAGVRFLLDDLGFKGDPNVPIDDKTLVKLAMRAAAHEAWSKAGQNTLATFELNPSDPGNGTAGRVDWNDRFRGGWGTYLSPFGEGPVKSGQNFTEFLANAIGSEGDNTDDNKHFTPLDKGLGSNIKGPQFDKMGSELNTGKYSKPVKGASR